ncbi:DUF72 domain-containing protein [Aliiglaciecola sp. CAU 1673]|uniref:DUF72 domain-containing protein n=1 Tax=Aliiglaciecola sp. CAU 1673 TaxID=3032595 RepID=UPI0023DB6B67|nr:DUF72 domain-containing protein [Aliiglaciecola sp. CAU 1673]MDF2177171.1 DUF72 domain-containing protein [Aliiglaciecola sp. CAU 1673]
MWQHPFWAKQGFVKNSTLSEYARTFNSVEGNTTFYQVPSREQMTRWMEAVPDGFQFCFKFHQHISHQKLLVDVAAETHDFLQLFAGFKEKLGCLMLQLPAHFGPEHLSRLSAFLQHLPEDFHYGVEVRHPAFFQKGEAEIALNRLLMEQDVNRVIMDTRGLFASEKNSGLIAEVKQKKPRVPVNVIATGNRPVVRFVGHPELAQNQAFLNPWRAKLASWIQEGKQPFMFFHMPDNGLAPWLAQQFFNHWPQAQVKLDLPSLSEQTTLF